MTSEARASAVPGRAHPAGLPALRRCLVMGVVNVTPDSFSDGGAWLEPAAAVAHGLRLAAEGADIVDVGGESTRPGAARVGEAEELRRIGPVVAELAAAGVLVSVDTMRSAVAEFALGAGARLVNDISGGQADPRLPRLVAAAGVPYVVAHWRGFSREMQERAVYDDVVREVRDELGRQVDAVTAAGVDPSMIIVDPGLGFAKLAGHNWSLLARLGEISRLGGGPSFPVLVGASRKSFLGRLLPDADGEPRPVTGRDDATVAVSALAAASGAWCVRVHAVAANADAVRVAARWRDARGPEAGDGLTSDRISLIGLRVFGRHGVLDHERRDGQEFVVDAVLWLDTRPAAAADDLALTVDYAAVAGRLAAVVSGEPVALIETLADRLAAACLSAHPAVRDVEITVHKPHAPLIQSFGDVTVTIRRSRA
jgi:dihydropteroate synthase